MKPRAQTANSNNRDFRVSYVKPMIYNSNARIKFLQQPKQEFQPENPFLHSEFRGLLNADFYDAVKNSNAQNMQLQDPNFQAGVKSFTTVREMFPAPAVFNEQSEQKV